LATGHSKTLFDELPHGRRQILAAGPDLGRRDMQPSGAALFRQDDRRTRDTVAMMFG
jgi:hypothetical protein